MAQVTLPYTLQAGQPENVNNLVANLNAIVAGVNTVSSSQLASGSVTSDKLASGIVPVGMIVPYAGSSAPTDWLLCNGDVKSQTTYAALYAVVGSTYNTSGEGAGNFRLPNLLGRVPVGRDAGQTEFDGLGETGGAKTHTLTGTEIPSHTHGLTVPYANNSANGATSLAGASVAATGNFTLTTAADGGGGAHNNLQPYLTLNYIIRAL